MAAANALQISPFSSPPKPNTTSPLSLLPHCTSLRELKQIQAFTIKTHLQNDINVLTKLISFCTLNPSATLMDHAHQLFDQIPQPDIVVFNNMARGYSRSNAPLRAIVLFSDILCSGIIPDDYTFPSLLKACASSKALQEARRVFDKIVEPCVVCYNAIITGYARNNLHRALDKLVKELKLVGYVPDISLVCHADMEVEDKEIALRYHRKSITFKRKAKENDVTEVVLAFNEDILPDGNCVNDPFSFTCTMKACGSLAYKKLALQLHGLVEKFDFGSNVYMAIQNSIMDMYIKSGKSHSTFVEMWSQGVRLNSMTYASVLSTCTSVYDLEWGTHLHARIVRMEPTIDVLVGSGLVDMYAKRGCLEFARNGVWCSQPEQVANIVVEFYQQLFSSGNPQNFDEVLDQIPNVVTMAMNDELSRIFTAAEVELSLK
nr:pentatricopeptide repeat-containing protein, chloroplastic [Quercus suber]